MQGSTVHCTVLCFADGFSTAAIIGASVGVGIILIVIIVVIAIFISRRKR